MNHPTTKRVINPQNQLIYAKNAFCVQLSLVLREHVNQNCTARLKKNRYRFFPMVTSSEAKRFGYRRENLFIFCFMIKCQHVNMSSCWQIRSAVDSIVLFQYHEKFKPLQLIADLAEIGLRVAAVLGSIISYVVSNYQTEDWRLRVHSYSHGGSHGGDI